MATERQTRQKLQSRRRHSAQQEESVGDSGALSIQRIAGVDTIVPTAEDHSDFSDSGSDSYSDSSSGGSSGGSSSVSSGDSTSFSDTTEMTEITETTDDMATDMVARATKTKDAGSHQVVNRMSRVSNRRTSKRRSTKPAGTWISSARNSSGGGDTRPAMVAMVEFNSRQRNDSMDESVSFDNPIFQRDNAMRPTRKDEQETVL